MGTGIIGGLLRRVDDQALLERELPSAIESNGAESLPLYPDGRPVLHVTRRHVIDVFELITRQRLQTTGADDFDMFTAELAPIQQAHLKLMGIRATGYYA